MTSRREFLEHIGWTSVPLAFGAFAIGLPSVSVAMPDAPISLHAVLIDAAYPQARNLGARLARRGATVHLDSGEITGLWLREIQPAWKQRPVALAGLTSSSTLFCLEQLAWSHGLRVVFHAEHMVLPSQETLHSLHTRDIALAPVNERALATAGANWNDRIGDVFESYNRNLPVTAAGPSCAGLEPAMPSGASLLTSWIIAPV